MGDFTSGLICGIILAFLFSVAAVLALSVCASDRRTNAEELKRSARRAS